MTHIAYRKAGSDQLWMSKYDFDGWVADTKRQISFSMPEGTEEQKAAALANVIVNVASFAVAHHGASEILLVAGGFVGGSWQWSEPTHMFDGKQFEAIESAVLA
jgi:hypothetical protein